MPRQIIFLILACLICFLSTFLRANQAMLTLELQNTDLPEAIRLIAKFLHLDVIISSSVNGVVTLNLHNAEPSDAFDLLLTSQGLAKWQVGRIWFIAPQEELIKRKQNAFKWREIDDDISPLTTHLRLIKYAKAEDIAHLLQDAQGSLMSKRGQVRVDVRTNVIGIQDNLERIHRINQWINRLDVPVKQISIEARLASVDYDFERELGIHFAVNQEAADGLQSSRYSLAIAKLADGSLLDVKLSALEKAGHAELISSPSLFTANQQAASIEAGEEVPYQQVSESGGTAVVFKKAVLGLKVTPQVLPGNHVLLQLKINQDRPSNKMVLGMPTISTRQIMTSVLVKHGQTIVLGGIYETNKESGEQGLPFIHRLPLLGLLFKQQNTRENKRELLIFVTPNIMTDT